MYEIEDIKYDFTNLNGGSFCQACLSSDRSLSLIGEYVDVFTLLSLNTMPQPLLLCWECMANLKRIKDFKDKIEEAQSILTYHYDNKQKLLLQSLSKLTKAYTDNIIFITYDEDEVECKEKLGIKQENEHSNDSFNNYEENIDFSRQEIKKESVNEKKVTKKRKRQKSKTLHYKIVYEKNAKKVLRKKFAIQLRDSKKWLEKEKNSDFFKKFKYKCEFCINGFNIKENLEKHVMKYHDESIGPHICPTCHVRFTNEFQLTEHIQTHGFAWECVRCGLQFYTAKRINAHIKTHGVVQCIYCEAKFLDLPSFNSHYKSLHSIFLCNDCDKRCRTKQRIEKHVLNRHLKQYPCLHCDRVYKSVNGLHVHCASVHTPSAAELSYCVLCDKQFRSEVSYRAHLRDSAAHRSERGNKVKKKFPCPECSNTYTRKTFMMNHYRHVHLKQSRHYCSDCDKYFLTRTRFVDHMRSIHEGIQKEKNKLCNICGRGFAAARTLENHMRTHSGERPFECEYCSAKFTQRVSMLSHVKHIHMKCKRRA